jgi:probable HAF family extracellular repeat protein
MRAQHLLITAIVLSACRDALEPPHLERSPAAANLRGAYEVIDLGTLGGTTSEAFSINARSQVVGSSQTASGETHAFLWENGVMKDLGTLGGDSSVAHVINEAGDVAGLSRDNTGAMRAVLWTGGRALDLGPARLLFGRTLRLSDAGHVVWTAPTASASGFQATLWDGSQVIDLGTLGGESSFHAAVNSRGQVVGWADSPSGERAFLWENGVMRDLGALNGRRSSASDINERGVVTGNYEDAAGIPRAFLWDGVMTDIGSLPNINIGHDEVSLGVALNARNQVIGTSVPRFFTDLWRGFIWENGVMRPLGPLPNVGGQERVAALNDRGQVIGVVVRFSSTRVFPWLWQDGVISPLPTLSADPFSNQNAVVAINNAGEIAGWSRNSSRVRRAALWRPSLPAR